MRPFTPAEDIAIKQLMVGPRQHGALTRLAQRFGRHPVVVHERMQKLREQMLLSTDVMIIDSPLTHAQRMLAILEMA